MSDNHKKRPGEFDDTTGRSAEERSADHPQFTTQPPSMQIDKCNIALAVYDAMMAHPKLTAADLRVYAALLNLGAEAYHEDVERDSGCHKITVSRSIKKLTAAGLVSVERRRVQRGKSESKNFYDFPQYQISDSAKLVPDQISDSAKLVPEKQPINNQSNKMANPCMIHDDEMNKWEKETYDALYFLDEGERQKRARQKKVTPSLAAAWREWFDRGEYGDIHSPAGFANSQLKLGNRPPSPQQLPLPGGVMDASGIFDVDSDQHAIMAIAGIIRAKGGNGDQCRQARELYFAHPDLDQQEIVKLAMGGRR